MGGRIGPVCDNLADATAPDPMGPAEAAQWAAAFDEFFVARKTNADAIADLALENFEEVYSYVFRLNLRLPVLQTPVLSSCFFKRKVEFADELIQLC